MLDRRYFETEEERRLSSYATLSSASRGRRHSEQEHAFRTAFQRDRDRIIHSTAFRRLEYKTQVFVNHEGDHYRTRLTHSLEAAQIARTIARALRLNEDVTEAVTLAHDLGHTPFGHSGEQAMNEIMRDHGGFEHNLQALRIVDFLEHRYLDFSGLNLTHEVREGIVKHSSRSRDTFPKEFQDGGEPVLEAQLVDLADEVAYTNHDLEDGLSSQILTLDTLKQVRLWRRHFEPVRYPDSGECTRLSIRKAVRDIINTLATDMIQQTLANLTQSGVRGLEDIRRQGNRLAAFSPSVEAEKRELKEFLFSHFYRDPRMIRMAEKACRVVQDLFRAYTSNPLQLPPHVEQRITAEGSERVACDYIAGMTDRFALDEHRKICDPHQRM